MTTRAPARPRVTALMPTYNASGFIAPVLDSLAAQTYPNLHVLIADDASTDDTAEMCARWAAGRPSVTLHRQATNRGWIDNTNWLLAHGEGDYFLFAFHDDPLQPTYVERLVDALEATPGAVLAYSDITLERESANGVWHGVATFDAMAAAHDTRARCDVMRAMEGYWWIPNRGVFRRAAALRVGGLRRNLAGAFCADWPWLLHLALLGGFIRVPDQLLHKRLRIAGLSQSWSHTATTRLAVVLAALREIVIADLPWSLRVRLAGSFSAYWTHRFVRKMLVNPLGR